MSEATTAGANRRYDIIPWAAQNALAPVIEMERGEGAYFYDTAGKRYLDFSSQLVNVNLGYQHPKVIAAIQEQAGKLCYIGPHHTTAAREKLGRKLAEIAPGDIQTAFFTGSGSEATEIAMTIARLVTGRRKILAKYRSYHGTTSGSLSASGDPRRLAVGYDHPNIVRFPRPLLPPLPLLALLPRLRRAVREERGRGDRARGARADRRGHRRADDGRERRDQATARVFPHAARDLRPPRHFDDRRRGHLRLRPHRALVRHRALGRGARPDGGLQGYHVGLHPDGRRAHAAPRRRQLR